MGIFTTGAVDSNIDIYSPVQEDFDVTGRYVNFHETAIRATVDSEKMYNNVMKSVGIAELHYFEAHGSEVVYEAADIGAFFEKIKAVFRKLIDKVKAIFHAFMTKLNTFTTKDKAFAKKYDKEFIEKWNKVSESADLINGFNYTKLDKPADDSKWCEIAVAAWKGIIGTNNWHLGDTLNKFQYAELKRKVNGNDETIDPNQDDGYKNYIGNVKTDKSVTLSNDSDHTALKSSCKYIKEHREDMQEAIRGLIIGALFENSQGTSKKLDDKDYADALFEGFRDGQSEKEKLSKSDIKVSAVDIISELKESEKTKNAAERATKRLIKAIDQNIKDLESMQKDCRNNISPDKGMSAYQAEVLSYITEITSLYRNHKEYAIQAKGAFLQALTERSRQYKAIVAKVIAGSKKITEESYDYSSGGSFLDSVTIV